MQKLETGESLARRNVRAIAHMEHLAESERTRGDRIADTFAHTIGSWKFIIIQSALLAVWVVLNITAFIYHWDPYPFILLNLALSFQAAYASPIIMMSQNRQARISERRNQLDLQINLLAEQESTETLKLLRAIGKKLDIRIDALEDALEQETRPDAIIKEIKKRLEKEDRA